MRGGARSPITHVQERPAHSHCFISASSTVRRSRTRRVHERACRVVDLGRVGKYVRKSPRDRKDLLSRQFLSKVQLWPVYRCSRRAQSVVHVETSLSHLTVSVIGLLLLLWRSTDCQHAFSQSASDAFAFSSAQGLQGTVLSEKMTSRSPRALHHARRVRKAKLENLAVGLLR